MGTDPKAQQDREIWGQALQGERFLWGQTLRNTVFFMGIGPLEVGEANNFRESC